MSKDRFKEFNSFPGRLSPELAANQSTNVEITNDEKSVEDFFNRMNSIKENVDTITEKVDNVRKRHQTINAAVSVQEEEKGKQELEQEQEIIKRLANSVRARLKKMQQEIEEEEKNHNEELERQGLLGQADEKSTEIRMKKTQQAAASRKFINVMTKYNSIQSDFRDMCKEKMKRQMEIMGNEVDDERLEEILTSGEAVPVFTGDIVLDTQKSKQVLDDIQSRKNDILALEKSIKELAELFADMATLVQEQGEMIDRVEYNIEHSVDFVSRAVADTKKAIELQREARKKKIIATICCLVLLLLLGWYVGGKLGLV